MNIFLRSKLCSALDFLASTPMRFKFCAIILTFDFKEYFEYYRAALTGSEISNLVPELSVI